MRYPDRRSGTVEVHDRPQKARLHESATRRIPSCHDFDSIVFGRSSLSANACKLVQADVGRIEKFRHVESAGALTY